MINVLTDRCSAYFYECGTKMSSDSFQGTFHRRTKKPEVVCLAIGGQVKLVLHIQVLLISDI